MKVCMVDVIHYLLEPYQSYTTGQIVVESLAALTGVVSVLFAQRRNIWVYPVGLISTVLYTYLFYVWGMYGETIINAYYTAMSVYGWVLWSRQTGADHTHVPVSWAQRPHWLVAAKIWVASFVFVLGVYYFRPWIQADFAASAWADIGVHHFTWVDYTDASLAAIFFAGMWFQAQRKIDNWTLWIVGDVVMVPLMLYKGYGITSLQYAVFVVLAVQGLLAWKQSRAQAQGLAAESSVL